MTQQQLTRADELAADFDELADIERVQDRHRAELTRRQEDLEADHLACVQLESLIAARATELLQQLRLLEHASRLAAADMLAQRPPVPGAPRAHLNWRRR